MLHTPTTKRRVVNFSITLLACVVAVFSLKVAEVSLANPNELSGWMLFISVFVLLLYAARKRLSTMPIGRVAIWLQVHIYLGVFCLFVFALHIHWRVPNGWFEIALAISLLGTIATGLLGLYWSRTIPTILTRVGDEVLYERIPAFAISLRDQAEAKVLEAAKKSGSHALSDFYLSAGHGFFAKPNFQWVRLYSAYTPIQKIERELGSARRFMSTQELEVAEDLLALMRQKDHLDAHYTLQGVLKHWLFVHLGFSLTMIPLLSLHIVLVYSFGLA